MNVTPFSFHDVLRKNFIVFFRFIRVELVTFKSCQEFGIREFRNNSPPYPPQVYPP